MPFCAVVCLPLARRSKTALLVLALLAAARSAPAALWEKTDFGMPLAAFRQAYPDARVATELPPEAELPYVSYRLTDRNFGPLGGCELEFSFTGAEPVLYRIQARCNATPEEVHRYLTATYGSPAQVSSSSLAWRTHGVEVTFMPKSGIFSIADTERSRAVAASLMRLLRQVPVGPTAPAHPSGAEKKP